MEKHDSMHKQKLQGYQSKTKCSDTMVMNMLKSASLYSKRF